MIFGVRSLVPDFLSSLVDSALRLPIAIERKLSRNEENHGGGGDGRNGREERSFGEFLRAVSTVSRKNSRREEEEEWEAGFTGDEREMEGLVDRYIVEIALIEYLPNLSILRPIVEQRGFDGSYHLLLWLPLPPPSCPVQKRTHLLQVQFLFARNDFSVTLSFASVPVSQDLYQGVLDCQPSNVFKMQAGTKLNWTVLT